MRVVITKRAERDLENIQTFIAHDSPGRALTFTEELRNVCAVTLAATPLIGAPRDEISPGLRAHPHKGYMICYRIRGETLGIVRVFQGSFGITRRF